MTAAERSRFRATTKDNMPNKNPSVAFIFGDLCRVRLSTVS